MSIRVRVQKRTLSHRAARTFYHDIDLGVPVPVHICACTYLVNFRDQRMLTLGCQ